MPVLRHLSSRPVRLRTSQHRQARHAARAAPRAARRRAPDCAALTGGRPMRRLLIIATLVLAPFAAQARNIALVVGNDAYANVPKLQKAVNDARSVSSELERLGFVVRRGGKVDPRAMSKKLFALDAHGQAGARPPRVFFLPPVSS